MLTNKQFLIGLLVGVLLATFVTMVPATIKGITSKVGV